MRVIVVVRMVVAHGVSPLAKVGIPGGPVAILACSVIARAACGRGSERGAKGTGEKKPVHIERASLTLTFSAYFCFALITASATLFGVSA